MKRLCLLALTALVALAAALPVAADASSTAAPYGFSISVNGRTLTKAQLSTAADTYIPVAAGRLVIGVRWITNLRGTGHKVVITSPGGATRRICTVGTSCVLSPRYPLKKGDESSWSIQIYRNNRLVSEKVVCLNGK
jgi:hypothetical protein